MKTFASLFMAWSLIVSTVCAQQTLTPPVPTNSPAAATGTTTTSADEVAIRQAIASYLAAFNGHDGKALAGHWNERGSYTPPGGAAVEGRAALETSFAGYFANNPSVRLELINTEVDVISPSVAIESGFARVISPDEEPLETEYEAIHVRLANGWKIDSISEAELEAPPVSNYENLKELEWMVGEWVDGDDSSSIETSCNWTTNKNFLVRSFNVLVEGKLDFSGTQIIGWDPVNESIRSWVFDSEGGFGVGRWSGEGGNWTIHTLNTLADGRLSSSTNTYQYLDDDSFTFKSLGRQVDGELLPNIDPVKVVRKTD
ncbi:YybH family protein [Bythopirellula polymerisocia]|uniref:SnoaL-like domain protein n=1 Tax=Bythopirellula polymerisocia TaxID=2528003 RepID=A0A5C6CY92_9BACT|nr:SgcJ/EcaC family oxidoreductase [Bythopirellula polymerisocia]TWU27609.1 SnoaL-like domain protein [Bythopirellula polymerisocia]